MTWSKGGRGASGGAGEGGNSIADCIVQKGGELRIDGYHAVVLKVADAMV